MSTTLEDRLKEIAPFNKTGMPFPEDFTIQEMFQNIAERDPDRCAVICDHDDGWGGTGRLTFRQLNSSANYLANSLRERGAGPDVVIGVLAERSFAMIIGIMGILKAGAAYLPLSPDGPGDRTSFMLENSGARIVIRQDTAHNLPPSFKGDVIDLCESEFQNEVAENPAHACSPRDLAYVIYTSGSTGKPKGVMIEHVSVINRIHWMHRLYPQSESSVILQKTPYFFDVSVWELFWWSMYGCAMCFLEPGGEKNPIAILNAIEKNGITTLHFVPSMLNAFLDYIEGRDEGEAKRLSSVERVFCSGEALTVGHVKKFNQSLFAKTDAKLINLYGPTEATVDVTYFDCPQGDAFDLIPIGRPIDNIQTYIVRDDIPAMIGETGELCLAGVGLARGYINNDRLTNERFVTFPFLPNVRMYKTGDLARWREDGNIEYLGREDHQVKIRGLRIELGEVESNIREHPLVRDCIVITKQYSESSIALVGYVVTKNGFDTSELKNYLVDRLPEYMIPNQIVEIDGIPLLPNGKADRKALPDPRKAKRR